MATLALRGLPADLMARIKAYASARSLSPRDAALALLTRGLDDIDARRAGGLARQAGLSPEERSALGTHAVSARQR